MHISSDAYLPDPATHTGQPTQFIHHMNTDKQKVTFWFQPSIYSSFFHSWCIADGGCRCRNCANCELGCDSLYFNYPNLSGERRAFNILLFSTQPDPIARLFRQSGPTSVARNSESQTPKKVEQFRAEKRRHPLSEFRGHTGRLGKCSSLSIHLCERLRGMVKANNDWVWRIETINCRWSKRNDCLHAHSNRISVRNGCSVRNTENEQTKWSRKCCVCLFSHYLFPWQSYRYFY